MKLNEICCTICQSWPRSPSSGLQPLKAVPETITQTAKPHTINGASNDSCGSCREFILHLPISAENPDPRLYIRAQYAETSQCSECGQQHGQRKCLQGRPATWYVTYTSGISHFWTQNKQMLTVILTRAEVRRTLPPQYEKRGMTVESTDRIWIICWSVNEITNETI